jgi:putative flippase GtrA
MITLPKAAKQLIFFSSIGATAGLAHILIVLNLVAHFDFHPLTANIIAFFFAFNVSCFGHKYLTFAQLNDEKRLSLPHFFMVATTAGLINEFLYFVILKYTDMNYLMALVLVLGLVAVYSFILSRFWACR